MIGLDHSHAWAAYHRNAAAIERAIGNPAGASFHGREARRAIAAVPQLRGYGPREGVPVVSSETRHLILPVASAGDVVAVTSGFVGQRASNREADGLWRGVEGVPVHAAMNATKMGATS